MKRVNGPKSLIIERTKLVCPLFQGSVGALIPVCSDRWKSDAQMQEIRAGVMVYRLCHTVPQLVTDPSIWTIRAQGGKHECKTLRRVTQRNT